MNILLIDVSTDFTDLSPGKGHTMHHPPMGLMYLTSFLKKHLGDRVSVQILDGAITFNPDYSNVVQHIRASNPDVVGLRSLTHTSHQLHMLAKLVKDYKYSIPVVVGGPYASDSSDRILEDKNIDVVCIGEGEKIFLGLISEYLRSSNIRCGGVSGIRYKCNGEMVSTGRKPLISDLDSIPYPDYSMTDINQYSRMHSHTSIFRKYAVLLCSRGCPYSCTYCHQIFGKSIRYRSPQNIVNEMRALREMFDIRDFIITDDAFNVGLKQAKAILRAIIDARLNPRLYFSNGLRGDVCDEEFVALLKEAGTVEVVVAIETASSRLQKIIRKNLRLEKVIDTMGALYRAGIVTNAFFMIGFPSETIGELKETVGFIRDHMDIIHFPYINIVRAYEGSELYKYAQEQHYDKDFLQRHALQGVGTQEASNTEYNFLPRHILQKAKREILIYFMGKGRMHKMLKMQEALFTGEELISKYSTYLGKCIGSLDFLLKICRDHE